MALGPMQYESKPKMKVYESASSTGTNSYSIEVYRQGDFRIVNGWARDLSTFRIQFDAIDTPARLVRFVASDNKNPSVSNTGYIGTDGYIRINNNSVSGSSPDTFSFNFSYFLNTETI